MRTNSGSRPYAGRMRLMTTSRSKPAGPEARALKTSAMPPRPSGCKQLVAAEHPRPRAARASTPSPIAVSAAECPAQGPAGSPPEAHRCPAVPRRRAKRAALTPAANRPFQRPSPIAGVSAPAAGNGRARDRAVTAGPRRESRQRHRGGAIWRLSLRPNGRRKEEVQVLVRLPDPGLLGGPAAAAGPERLSAARTGCSYSDFKDAVAAGKVDDVAIGATNHPRSHED